MLSVRFPDIASAACRCKALAMSGNRFRDLFKFCPKKGFVVSLLLIRKVILVGSCVVNGWLLIFRGSANKASFKRDDDDFCYRLNIGFHVMVCGCINFALTKVRKIYTG